MNAERCAPVGDWPEGGLERVDACPVCGSTARTTLFDDLRDRIFFCAPGCWTMVQCSDCNSGYLDPRPTAATIGQAYEDYYTHQEMKERSLLQRIRWALANGYKNWRFGAKLSPSSWLGVPIAYLIPGSRRLFERQFRHLPRRDEPGRVLDVGFGDGGFLKLAEAAGWTAVGTDFDPVVIANARERGLSVVQGTVDEVDGPFDMITLCHTLEHFHDPVGVLRKCFDLLKPGGKIWIETPNIDSLGRRKFGGDWRGLEPPRHLVLFSRHALKQALSGIGFVAVDDLSQPGVVSGLYAMSENIRERREPTAPLRQSLSMRLAIARDTLLESLDPGVHEFLAITATKGP